jgi:ketosteroid isomerase-like protein
MTIEPRRNPKAQIRALLEDWMASIRVKDAAAVMSHYANNLVQFDLAPPLQYCGENALNKAALEDWFSTFRGSIGYEILDPTITADDEIAFCHSLNHLTGTKTTGENVDVWLRATVGFRKIDQKWAITHWHESVPFYMDGSYRAAIDLKP